MNESILVAYTKVTDENSAQYLFDSIVRCFEVKQSYAMIHYC